MKKGNIIGNETYEVDNASSGVVVEAGTAGDDRGQVRGDATSAHVYALALDESREVLTLHVDEVLDFVGAGDGHIHEGLAVGREGFRRVVGIALPPAPSGVSRKEHGDLRRIHDRILEGGVGVEELHLGDPWSAFITTA